MSDREAAEAAIAAELDRRWKENPDRLRAAIHEAGHAVAALSVAPALGLDESIVVRVTVDESGRGQTQLRWARLPIKPIVDKWQRRSDGRAIRPEAWRQPQRPVMFGWPARAIVALAGVQAEVSWLGDAALMGAKGDRAEARSALADCRALFGQSRTPTMREANERVLDLLCKQGAALLTLALTLDRAKAVDRPADLVRALIDHDHATRILKAFCGERQSSPQCS